VHPFHIDAMVILPDHLHAMWTLMMRILVNEARVG